MALWLDLSTSSSSLLEVALGQGILLEGRLTDIFGGIAQLSVIYVFVKDLPMQ